MRARQFETIATQAADGILVIGADDAVLFANPASEALLDRAGGVLIGTRLGQPIVAGTSTEMRILRKSGELITVEMRAAAITWDGAPAVLVSLRDVSERVQAKTQIEHLNSVLRAIRKVNQLIVRERNPEKLIRQTCHLLTETRGFDSAWIAVGCGAGPTDLSAHAGCREAFDSFAGLLRKGEWPRCLEGALAAEDCLVISAPASDCKGCPLAPIYGCNRAVITALRHGDQVLGLVGVSFPPRLAIDGEETSLLTEVADDVAFALHGIEVERLRSESEERFKTITESSADAIFIANRQGEYVYANKASVELLGYTSEELLQMTIADVSGPEQAAESFRRFEELLANGRASFEFELVSKDGTVIPVDLNATVLPNGLVYGSCRDITERKKAEAELRLKDAAVAASITGIVINDLQGMITYVNPAFAKMHGYDPDEVIGNSVASLWPDQSKEVLESVFQQGSWVGERDVWRKDGSLASVQIAINLIRDAAGQPMAVMGAFLDISERKKLEEQVRSSQKMEAIGSLAGGVAHDFNNLLSVILSYTGFAIEGVREGDPLREDLMEVKKAGERAAALTRQLLAFSRRQVLESVPLDLNMIAAGVEKMLGRILGEDIDLALVLSEDLGVIRADPGQMEQVLVNLAVNSRDAMPDGGKLTIETSNVEIDEEYASRHAAVKPGPYVQLAVTDTGLGMDEQTKARLFEPFFSTKEKGKGTGLGMSTVYGIVKQSGGDIWVYSELGQGTTFKIHLPREPSSVAAVSATPALPRRFTGTETILVVEDEEPLRRVAERLLEAAGYTVLTAADGEEALRTSAQHAGEIHLLLTDVVMPRMNGRALAEELKKRRPTLEVVYMSGYTDDAIVHHGVLEAGTHFVAKPFSGRDLTLKIRTVLDAETTVAPGRYEHMVEAGAQLDEPPLDRASLRAFPEDVLGRLRRAVVAARYDEIIEIVETMRATEPGTATRLLRMADLFDFDGMRGLLGEGSEVPRGG